MLSTIPLRKVYDTQNTELRAHRSGPTKHIASTWTGKSTGTHEYRYSTGTERNACTREIVHARSDIRYATCSACRQRPLRALELCTARPTRAFRSSRQRWQRVDPLNGPTGRLHGPRAPSVCSRGATVIQTMLMLL